MVLAACTLWIVSVGNGAAVVGFVDRVSGPDCPHAQRVLDGDGFLRLEHTIVGNPCDNRLHRREGVDVTHASATTRSGLSTGPSVTGSHSTAPPSNFKTSIAVWLGLYPTVVLASLLTAPLGLPFWLAMLTGNLLSSFVMNYLTMPYYGTRILRWWLNPSPSARQPATDIKGLAVVLVINGIWAGDRLLVDGEGRLRPVISLRTRIGLLSYPTNGNREVLMSFDPKNAVNAARDIATHAVEKAADIVEDAGHILKGNIAEGTSAIVEDSMDIATHAVDKAKEVFSGKDDAGDESPKSDPVKGSDA